MANMRSLTVFAFLGAASILLHCTTAANYQVGNSFGWQNPNNATLYSAWASTHTFAVGDTLTFSFATGSHDVATVSQSDYDSCNTNQNNVETTGPANITLTAGTHYYLCTFSNHCSSGQKLSVTVNSSGTASPPGSPPSNGTTTPPPPPPPPPSSSASSIGATAALMFLSIVMGFMFYF